MFVVLAVSLSLLGGAIGSCPGNTEVYTGDGRVQWKAEINGVDSPGVLAPNNQKFFFVADERMIDVMVKLVPNNLLLQEISIETLIVKKVSAHGQSMEIDSESWETTRFTYDNLPINNVDVFVESEGSEMEIRNVFIRGCVPIDWCPWDSWSDCSVSCGVGQQTRMRECRCPNPDPALFQCEGPDTQTRTCQQPCCEEQIDFNNRKGVKVQVKGPGVVKGVDLLLGAPASQNVLVNNSDGINFIAITFQGRRDILEVGLETQFSGKVKLKAKPGKWTATDSVPVDDNYYKSTFKAPGGQLSNQKSLTLKFNYPSGEIGVRRLYLIVCKK